MGTLRATTLEAGRLRLRSATDADVEGIVETQTDEHLRRYLGGPRPAEQVRELVVALGASTLLPGDGGFVVADKVTDEMLGTILLDRRAADKQGHVDGGDELELIYILRRHAWGQGYAEEAARTLLRAAATQLPDQPVLVVTQTANTPSRRLAARLGFRPVATFEEHDAEQLLAVAPLHTFAAPRLR